ncbi:MAG TPA: hypothetical protein VHG89_05965 [Verrucomicrobiae bacterium]|nr:hypothetical protein [Verrucomicrobiae bacterium]
MKKYLILLCGVLLLSGCVPFNYNATVKMYRDDSDIKQGVLVSGQSQKRFRSIWGLPTKTYSRRFDVGAHGSVFMVRGIGGGSFSARSGETYDLWFYQERAVTLIFDRGELIYWIYSSQPPTDLTFETEKIE